MIGDARDAREEAVKVAREWDAVRDDDFESWIGDPLTRITLSLIPQGENADALKVLVRAAFNAGFRSGTGTAMASMARRILDARKGER